MNDKLKAITMQATEDVLTMHADIVESPMLADVPAQQRDAVAANLVVAVLLRMNQIDASLP